MEKEIINHKLKMKTVTYYFFILLFLFISPILEGDIRYAITSNRNHEIEIAMDFKGNSSGVTEFVLPSSWAGKSELYEQISHLSCPSHLIENTDAAEIKRISHEPGERIKLLYRVQPSKIKEKEWYYRPIVHRGYFFFFGHCLFIIPNVDPDQRQKIVLDWTDLPARWNVANSFGVNQRRQELASLTHLLHSVYCGGDFKILQCGKQSTPIYIALRNEWAFSDYRLMNLIETIIETQREFWNDYDFPFYLITLLSTGEDHDMGGTGLTNAFSLFINNINNDNREDWKWLSWLLSHEHFHTWNGIKMHPIGPEGSLYWFTEGFTDYYAYRLIYKSRIIDKKDYFEKIRSIVEEYQNSPVRNANNEEIQQKFWLDPDIQRLPYTRGFLIALIWDYEIQSQNRGNSLDSFMKQLYQHAHANQNMFTYEDIKEVASIFLGKKIPEYLEKYAIKGETIKFEFEHVLKKLL